MPCANRQRTLDSPIAPARERCRGRDRLFAECGRRDWQAGGRFRGGSMSVKKMKSKKKAPDAIINAAHGAAIIFTDKDGTMALFYNSLIADSEVRVAFGPSDEPDRRTSAFSVCLFFNGDMIACDHGATWEQAMAY